MNALQEEHINAFKEALTTRTGIVEKQYKKKKEDIKDPKVIQNIKEDAYYYFLGDDFKNNTDNDTWIKITAGRMLLEEGSPDKALRRVHEDYEAETPFDKYSKSDQELAMRLGVILAHTAISDKPEMKHEVILGEKITGFRRKVTIDGIPYDSLIHAYDKLGINDGLVYRMRIQNNVTQEEAISMAIEYVKKMKEKRAEISARQQAEWDAQEARRKARKEADEFTFHGKTYPSFKYAVGEISWENDILLNPDSIKASARRNRCSLEVQLQKTFEAHMKSKLKNENEWRQKSGSFYKKLMGEIYYEALEMVKESGLSGMSDEGAAKVIAEKSGATLKYVNELIDMFLEDEPHYAHIDSDELECIRKDVEERRYKLYCDTYNRHDWPKKDKSNPESETKPKETNHMKTITYTYDETKCTNRDYLILELTGSIDDGGAGYESVAEYNISCPYHGDNNCLNHHEGNKYGTKEHDKACVRCKLAWLDRQYDTYPSEDGKWDLEEE